MALKVHPGWSGQCIPIPSSRALDTGPGMDVMPQIASTFVGVTVVAAVAGPDEGAGIVNRRVNGWVTSDSLGEADYVMTPTL